MGNIHSKQSYVGYKLFCFNLLGGGFRYLLFSPLFGEDSHFDYFFSKGLKPPISLLLSRPGVPGQCRSRSHGETTKGFTTLKL